MRAELLLAGYVALLASSGTSSFGKDAPSIRAAYTQTAAILFIAEDVCAGVKPNLVRLLDLRMSAHFKDSEEETVNKMMADAAIDVKSAIAGMGTKNWCESVWSLYGPSGSFAPGMVSR